MYQEIDGDLIALAKKGEFDAIAHGCNCFCTMGAGIAPQMAKAFKADERALEGPKFKGSMNKLGMIDYGFVETEKQDKKMAVINAYTQYGFGANHPGGDSNPLDYAALRLCLKKINHRFKGKLIGLPKIGCGLAGGDWDKVSQMIQEELIDCQVTVVNYVP